MFATLQTTSVTQQFVIDERTITASQVHHAVAELFLLDRRMTARYRIVVGDIAGGFAADQCSAGCSDGTFPLAELRKNL